MFKKLFLSVLIATLLFVPTYIQAQSVDELQEQINQYTQKLNELGTAKNTLSNQVKLLDSQYQLTLLKITQTENSIKVLEKEIGQLNVEIGKLEVQIDKLSAEYIHQTVQNYKLQKKIPSFAYIFTSGLNTFLEQHQYVSAIQKNSQENLINLETVRTNYDEQKTVKAEKQDEMEALQKTLAGQKTSLTSQKASKNSLLESTKNDEKKYQQLLSEAQSQLAALKNFSSGAGGGACLDSSPAQSGDGYENYFSQRDKKWCNYPINPGSLCSGRSCINDEDDDIGHIGCAITSYAIVLNKKGTHVTPEDIARDPSNFCDGGGNCYSYAQKLLINRLRGNYQSYNTSVIDSEINQGHYVILELSAFGGTHFVVIISGSGGNYKIHDPWYGANMNLNDKYQYNKKISIRLMW